MSKLEKVIITLILACVVVLGIYKMVVVGGYFINEGREYHRQVNS